ncbi:helix-turn-helix domain-containing protein [Amycolatopsis sp. CB00013]|uniref:helix-turn-helix domain-containing protein n=1 Tax=Amycolatopsis sp. CB00013 TaxID=1703945 RepID=UPI00093D2A9E
MRVGGWRDRSGRGVGFLDHFGDTKVAAAQLYLHLNAFRYRLRRIRVVSGSTRATRRRVSRRSCIRACVTWTCMTSRGIHILREPSRGCHTADILLIHLLSHPAISSWRIWWPTREYVDGTGYRRDGNATSRRMG